MPNLNEFDSYANIFHNQVLIAGSRSVNVAIDAGADFMREAIVNGSPTGHPWHAAKNAANGFPDGARIGNRVPFMYKGFASEIDYKSGNMLKSVTTMGPVTSGDRSKIAGLFGWIDPSAEDSYFVQQDTGKYGVGKQVGMGLLNVGNKSGKKFAAMMAAQTTLESEAIKNGFKVSGSELF